MLDSKKNNNNKISTTNIYAKLTVNLIVMLNVNTLYTSTHLIFLITILYKRY